jgi:hypothetical protein
MATRRPHAFDDDPERLFEILDDLAGVPEDRERPDPETTEPVALTEGLAERGLEDLRRLRAAASGSGCAARATRASRRWWRRPAALWPMGIVFLFSASIPFLTWSGRNSSEELAYEEAFEFVFDAVELHIESRASAMARIAKDLHVGSIVLLEHESNGDRSGVARDALASMRDMANIEAASKIRRRPPTGSMASALERMQSTKISVSERDDAIADFLVSARAGFALIHRASARKDLIGRMAGRHLGSLRKRLE